MLWLCAVAIVIATSISTCESANLAEAKWESKVNTVAKLKDVLAKTDVKAIEIDVKWGKYYLPFTPPPTWDPNQPEDPDMDTLVYQVVPEDFAKKTRDELVIDQYKDTSDFTFQAFLEHVIEHSKANQNNMKSIKLNFKSYENAVPKAVDIILKKHREIKFPLWMHGDIVRGPSGFTPRINTKSFLGEYNKTSKYVLSVGWTTKWTPKSEAGYTKKQTEQMAKVLKEHLEKGSKDGLNFPIHAGFAINSQDILEKFYKDTKALFPQATFSIWSDDEDLDVEQLKTFIGKIGVESLYVNLSDELKTKLNLVPKGNGNNGGGTGGTGSASQLTQFGLLNVAVLIMATVFRNGLH